MHLRSCAPRDPDDTKDSKDTKDPSSKMRALSQRTPSRKVVKAAVQPPQPAALQPAAAAQPTAAAQTKPAAGAAAASERGTKGPKERLLELKELLDEGLIDQVEFDAKRLDILAAL